MEYLGSMRTGTRICALAWLRYLFSTHDMLYLTTLQHLLQLITYPEATNGDSSTIIYQITGQAEGWKLNKCALQPSPSNACKVKFVFECVKVSLFGMGSVIHFSKANENQWQDEPYSRMA